MSSPVKAILGVSRAPFLLLPVVLICAGAAASACEGGFLWSRSILALIGLLALHMGVNALNEASDMRTGIDLNTKRTPFSGGSGTLPAGELTIRTAFIWGLLTTMLGLAIGIWFLTVIGWALLPLVAVGVFAVLTYTRVLARIGLGEIFAGLGLGCLPIIGASLVQDGRIGSITIAASIPAFFMTLNLLLLNEFPDEDADRTGGRRNLVLLLGRKSGGRIYIMAVAATAASIVAGWRMSALPIQALIALPPTLLTLPAVRWAFGPMEEAISHKALGGNVAWNLLTNLFLAGGLAWAAWTGI